jgi:hypothetical protein
MRCSKRSRLSGRAGPLGGAFSPRSGGLIQKPAAQWAFAAWVILVLALYFAQFDAYWNRLLQIVGGALVVVS